MSKIKLVLFSISLIFIACNKKEPISVNEAYLTCDVTGNYKAYINTFSKDYKSLLFKEYKTTSEVVLLDSIKKERIELHEKIKNGEISQENSVIKEEKTTVPNTSIVKYRSTLIFYSDTTKTFKEKVFIKTLESGEEKIITYYSDKKIDSLIRTKYSNEFLNKIKKISEFEELNSNDKVFYKIKKRYYDYIKSFESNNDDLLDFIYPPVFDILIRDFGNNEPVKEVKKSLINEMKLQKKNQALNFSKFHIDNFKKLPCGDNHKFYILNYAISLGSIDQHVYIPVKIIVIYENDKYYFIEYNKEEFESTLSTLFDPEIMKCIISHGDIK